MSDRRTAKSDSADDSGSIGFFGRPAATTASSSSSGASAAVEASAAASAAHPGSSYLPANDPRVRPRPDLEVQARAIAKARPHRCGARLDDLVQGVWAGNFRDFRYTWRMFRECMNNPLNEPREPFKNLPVHSLPLWDPRHPRYDPDREVPYDSFPKQLMAPKVNQ